MLSTSYTMAEILEISASQDVITIFHLLACKFKKKSKVLRKILESGRIYVISSTLPFWHGKKRQLMDWAFIMLFTIDDDPDSASQSDSYVLMLQRCIKAIRDGIYNEVDIDLCSAVGLLWRSSMLAAGYGEQCINKIADIMLAWAIAEGNIATQPKDIHEYTKRRRLTIAVPWLADLELTYFDNITIEQRFIDATADCAFLGNDVRSGERERLQGVCNILNYLDQEQLFVMLDNAYNVLDDAIKKYGNSMSAEILVAEIAGVCCVYALMERYNGWRYDSESAYIQKVRNYEKDRCLKLTESVMQNLRDVLISWGNSEQMHCLKWNTAFDERVLFSERAISYLVRDTELLVPIHENDVVLPFAEIAWWLCSSSGLDYCQKARDFFTKWKQTIDASYKITDIEDLRVCAALAMLDSKKNIEQLRVTVLEFCSEINLNKSNLNVIAVSEALHAILETGIVNDYPMHIYNMRDYLIKCLQLPELTLQNTYGSPCWAFRASVARIVLRWPDSKFISPMREALHSVILRHDVEEKIGPDHFHSTAECALAKLSCGIAAKQEIIALDAMLSSVGFIFETIDSVTIGNKVLISSGWTTVLASVVVNSNENIRICHQSNVNIDNILIGYKS